MDEISIEGVHNAAPPTVVVFVKEKTELKVAWGRGSLYLLLKYEFDKIDRL
jgi:hypothetical protein